MQEFGLTVLCITKSEKGSTLYAKDTQIDYKILTDRQNEIVDTVGAGDAFAAILAFGILKKWDKSLTLKRASEFALNICGNHGALQQIQILYKI